MNVIYRYVSLYIRILHLVKETFMTLGAFDSRTAYERTYRVCGRASMLRHSQGIRLDHMELSLNFIDVNSPVSIAGDLRERMAAVSSFSVGVIKNIVA